MRYELVLSPDDNGTWMVTAPAFEEVVSFGSTQEEARRNGLNAIEEAIAARKSEGKPVPEPISELRS